MPKAARKDRPASTRWFIAPTVVLFTLMAFVLSPARTMPQLETIRLLLLSGANNHDWKATTPELKKIYEKSGRFMIDVLDDPSILTSDMLGKYDAVVSNWSAWPQVTGRQWGQAAEKAFLDFVSGGKGFALVHAASATMQDWQEYQTIVGATWGLSMTAHGRIGAHKVIITDHDHPITKGMEDFWTVDEVWYRMTHQPSMNVLGYVFTPLTKPDEGLRFPKGGTDKFEPVLVYTHYGKGRCFYNVLGHDAAAMSNLGFKTLMLRGTEWAATGKVTIPIPDGLPLKRADAQKAYDDTQKVNRND